MKDNINPKHYAASDYTEDNIIWALACVKDLLKRMPSETEGKNA